MHIAKTLAIFCLGSGALSFKIRAFTGNGCTGSAKEINVWDNTCRNTDVPATRSFRVLSYGGRRQRAGFYKNTRCGAIPENGEKDWWADGGSDTFKKNKCITLGYEANSR
ncbi:hypothetical protein VFPPC_03741 [Pochonia chlamydosporia 170]|uniref:Uncharacterized protein n=1 Tax=Pochonia chlamydosporia 170 TaxID=1380566 RepID=A0A179G245_METCM|nr:hypothetical protein VFPPC_03741 [Pochonia chlamydosporia 170]OAQ71443.2 hypothetical protein VFPPC_03741 [Pochonia chlamydosporia 170]